MKTTDRTFTLRIDADLLAAVTEAGEKLDISTAQIVRRLLRNWIENGAKDLIAKNFMVDGKGE